MSSFDIPRHPQLENLLPNCARPLVGMLVRSEPAACQNENTAQLTISFDSQTTLLRWVQRIYDTGHRAGSESAGLDQQLEARKLFKAVFGLELIKAALGSELK